MDTEAEQPTIPEIQSPVPQAIPPKSQPNRLLIAIIVIIAVSSIAIVDAYLTGLKNGQFQSSQAPLNKCVDINIPKYEIAKTDQYDAKGNRINGKSVEYLADLKGDGQKELVRVYDEQSIMQRQLPVTVKIFSGKPNCYEEELSYNGKESGSSDRSGNELNNAKLLTNFWDDGKDVVMAIFESTGYGSGWTAYMNFITFQNGKYIVVNGPTINDLSLYMFNGKNADGLEIIVANAVWASDEGHFDPHKYTFEKYSFNGKEYIKKLLATTKNKYNNTPIQEILQKEPEVVL